MSAVTKECLGMAAKSDLWLDHILFYSIPYQLTHRAHVELTQNIGPMSFGCLDADSKNYSDFFAAFAFCHEL